MVSVPEEMVYCVLSIDEVDDWGDMAERVARRYLQREDRVIVSEHLCDWGPGDVSGRVSDGLLMGL